LNLPNIGQGVGEYRWLKEHVHLIREGIELGANLIDTAESYDSGRSEEIIGEAISGIRDKVIIATKFSPENHRREDVFKSIESSLKRLKTDYIDIYQLHWPNPEIDIYETLSALSSLRDQGKILKIGMNNLRFNQLKLASDFTDIFSIQLEYNLFDREVEKEIIPFCEEKSIRFFAYSPLDKGRISHSNLAHKNLEKIAEKYSAKPSQVALSWISRNKMVIPIPKSTNINHLRSNIESASLSLTEDEIESISQIDKIGVTYIDPSKISVINEGEGNRKTYQTLEQAINNNLGYVPSPKTLSSSISESDLIKPVRVVKNKNKDKILRYNLVEGRIRYWAWVMKFGNKPIPCLIRNDTTR